jgi:hypothetical protein
MIVPVVVPMVVNFVVPVSVVDVVVVVCRRR